MKLDPTKHDDFNRLVLRGWLAARNPHGAGVVVLAFRISLALERSFDFRP